jgi:hypothetical protein
MNQYKKTKLINEINNVGERDKKEKEETIQHKLFSFLTSE